MEYEHLNRSYCVVDFGVVISCFCSHKCKSLHCFWISGLPKYIEMSIQRSKLSIMFDPRVSPTTTLKPFFELLSLIVFWVKYFILLMIFHVYSQLLVAINYREERGDL